MRGFIVLGRKSTDIDVLWEVAMRLQTLPTRSYWAVFDVRDPKKPFIVAMFVMQLDAKRWVKEEHYEKDEYVLKRVFCEVKVDVDAQR